VFLLVPAHLCSSGQRAIKRTVVVVVIVIVDLAVVSFLQLRNIF